MSLTSTKTPHRNVSLAALARINDQLCFYLFADAELEPKLGAALVSRKDDFTSEVFPNNGYSSRIHVTMSELVAFRSEQLNQALAMSFAFAVEQVLVYLEQTVKFWSQTNRIDAQFAEPAEAFLQTFAKSNALVQPSIILLKTVKYLRLRRNHVIHSDEVHSSELVKLFKHDAKSLDDHWSSQTKLPGLSFLDHTVLRFGPDECITLIKLMRVCIEEIDCYVSTHVNAEEVVRILDRQLLQRQPELRGCAPAICERRIRKIRKRGKELYGLEASTTEIAALIGVAI